MLSLRLKKIVSLLDSQDKVVDIGCDHGYLGIYAIREKLVKSIILTDIKESALSMARKNVKNSNLDIPLIVSDGLNNINSIDINMCKETLSFFDYSLPKINDNLICKKLKRTSNSY